jgi:hypothetical protein
MVLQPAGGRRDAGVQLIPHALRQYPGVLAAACVIVAAYLFVVLTNMRPAFDAFGWLMWGHQALHWNLDLNSAPSWKPLTFLFTFPYALAGHGQVRLWMVTAVAGAFAGSVFAARIAWGLARREGAPTYAAAVAGAFAAIGLLGISGWWDLITISNSDPMDVTLCLAAIDAHLSRKPRLAFAALVFASLGRPEAWPFTGLYAIWLWRTQPKARALLAGAIAIIPLLWFGIPALAAKSWFVAANTAIVPRLVLHGDRFTGALRLYFDLYPLAVWLAIAVALALALLRRERISLTLAGAALTWLAIEIAFIYHGWPAQSRYMTESAAVLMVLAAAGAGRLLGLGDRARWPLRAGSIVAVAALAIAVIPAAGDRVATARADIAQRRAYARQLTRLQRVIDYLGGARRIRSCGEPASVLGLQTALAYQLGMNAAFVGWDPGKLIHQQRPIVLFTPLNPGWRVRPIHTAPRCATLSLGP